MKCFVLLVIAVSAVFAAPPPGCSYDDLKKCDTFEGFKWPKNIADVTKGCELSKQDDACLQAFNKKCVKSSKALQIAGEIHDGLVTHYTEVCTSDKGKQDFLNRVNNCYSKPNVVSQFKDIHKRYVGLVEKLDSYGLKGGELPAYCCAILYFRDSGKKVNEHECKAEDAAYIDNHLNAIFQKPFHEECGDVSSYPQCASSKLNAAQQADFKKIIDANPPLNTNNEFALPTLYKIFNRDFNHPPQSN